MTRFCCFWTLTLMMALAGLQASALGKRNGPATLRHQGHIWVPLEEFARYYALEGPKVDDEAIVLRNSWTELRFRHGSRLLTYNGTQVWMSSGSKKIRGRWCIAQDELLKTFDPLLRPYAHVHRMGYKTVVLDPGHGGEDPGAEGSAGSNEKIMALDIARRVRDELEAVGVKVVLTRDTDRFLTLAERPRLAQGAKGDLFVSIHLNGGSSTAQGTEVYALSLPGRPSSNDPKQEPGPPQPSAGNRYDPANILLAWHLQHALRNDGGTIDRGVRRARFQVLREAPCPAALVECGYLTNPTEEKQFQREAHRKQIARGISRGILSYLERVTKAHLIGTPRTPSLTNDP